MENPKQQVPYQNGTISKWVQAIILITTVCFLIVAFFMNIFMRQSLFLMGINFIQDYQSSQPNQFVRAVYNLFSILGNTYFIVGSLVLIFLAMYRKLLVVVYLTYILSNIYILGMMKPSFQEARPFWFTDQIRQNQWSCQKQYGFPSGHSLISALFYEPIFAELLICHCFRVPLNKILLIFPFITAIFIPVSRLYLGSHSTNQIMFGLFMSFCALVLYRFIFQKLLYRLYQQVLNTKKSIFIPLIIIVSFIVLIMGPIILYLININTRNIDSKYLTNIINTCKNNQTYEKIEGQQLQSISFFQIIYGFLFGCLIASSQCFQQYQFSKKLAFYFTGRWAYISFVNVLLVLLVYLVLLAPVICFFFVGLDFFLHNFIAVYLLKSLGALLIGIIIFVIVPLISIRFGLITIIYDEQQTANNDKGKVQEGKQISKIQSKHPLQQVYKTDNDMKSDLQFAQNI